VKLFVVEVTVTLAPATALPWGSVTVPMMLPKTACPDVVEVFSKIDQNKTANPNTTSRFAIPPLLADPFPHLFLHGLIVQKSAPNLDSDSHSSANSRALSIWLNVSKEGCAQTPEEEARLNL
jgi:hypothetical protein